MKISRRPTRRAKAIRHAPICPECGKPGRHYITFPASGLVQLLGLPSSFWVCDKFYGPDGRRIDP